LIWAENKDEAGVSDTMKTLEQVETISDKDRRLLHEVKQTVQSFLPAAEVLLYGSVARGTQDAESDYDILVLSDVTLSRAEERAVDNAILELELNYDIVLSTIYHSKDFWRRHRAMPFLIEVENEGVVV
jgi:predicted nucleotidyltransferase